MTLQKGLLTCRRSNCSHGKICQDVEIRLLFSQATIPTLLRPTTRLDDIAGFLVDKRCLESFPIFRVSAFKSLQRRSHKNCCSKRPDSSFVFMELPVPINLLVYFLCLLYNHHGFELKFCVQSQCPIGSLLLRRYLVTGDHL